MTIEGDINNTNRQQITFPNLFSHSIGTDYAWKALIKYFPTEIRQKFRGVNRKDENSSNAHFSTLLSIWAAKKFIQSPSNEIRQLDDQKKFDSHWRNSDISISVCQRFASTHPPALASSTGLPDGTARNVRKKKEDGLGRQVFHVWLAQNFVCQPPCRSPRCVRVLERRIKSISTELSPKSRLRVSLSTRCSHFSASTLRN